MLQSQDGHKTTQSRNMALQVLNWSKPGCHFTHSDALHHIHVDEGSRHSNVAAKRADDHLGLRLTRSDWVS